MAKAAQVVEITPRMAMEWLKNNSKNRKLNLRTVHYYAEQMIRGEWVLTGQGVSIDSEGNVLDGQHRLNAIIKADKPIKMYVFKDMDPKTFDRYDVGKTRSAGDIFTIAGIKNANNISASIKYYSQFSIRKKQSEDSVKGLGLTRHELLEKYNEGPEFWQEINRIAVRCWSFFRLYNMGFLGGFIAHAILDKGYPIDKVKTFCEELHQLNPDTNNSTIVLRTTLIRDAMSMKRYTPSIKRIFLTKCWNAYFEGKEIKNYTFKDGEEVPVMIHHEDLTTTTKMAI